MTVPFGTRMVLRSRLQSVAISMLPEAVPPRDHRTPRGGTPRGEDSVPRITPLQAAKQRLQWSKTLHERLGVDCYYCEDYYVVANVGRLVCAVETKDQRRVVCHGLRAEAAVTTTTQLKGSSGRQQTMDGAGRRTYHSRIPSNLDSLK